eukprot:CAMPEP_0196663320 /NCGR_PEP_ID=MMETSP1086-20130531/52415_1 /TAXON_ID=77921 /ORGANISM="Cyanoptyche  gloeocystis , Strain SAG4.97" /LENGTH=32 /DNA_ID= /DNA_START= /DNA_END= /DNA_ORIENTATION=
MSLMMPVAARPWPPKVQAFDKSLCHASPSQNL